MKKLLTFCLCLLCFSALFAQKGLHLGFGLMPQATFIFNDRDIDPTASQYEYRFTYGYAGGLDIGYNFIDPFGVHTYPTWSRQGQNSVAVDAGGNEFSRTRTLDYIKIPLIFQFHSGPAKNVFVMGIGPSFNILSRATHEIEGNLGTLQTEASDYYKDLNMAFAFKLGGLFAMSDRAGFNLELRGDYSLGDVEDKDYSINDLPVYEDTRSSAKNLSVGVYLGFTFVVSQRRKYYCD